MSSNCRETTTWRGRSTESVCPSSKGWEIGQALPGRLTTRGMLRATKATPQPHKYYTHRAWRFFGNSVTAGELPAFWLIWEVWRGNRAIILERTPTIGKA